MTMSLNVLSKSETHPLEPLSPEEIRRAVATVREQRGLSPHFRFVAVMLHEPAKGEVRPPREAFLILLGQRHGAGVRGGGGPRGRAGSRRSRRCRRTSSRRSCSTSSSSARRRSSGRPSSRRR